MPKGVYPRTQNQLAASVANLAKGREPEARGRSTEALRAMARDPEWRLRVSEATRQAMRSPEIRQRHLDALKGRSRNFRGGNGMPILPIVAWMASLLQPLGYQREYPIKTKGHGTVENPPRSYKADFAHLESKTAIELDGPCHLSRARQDLDRKKTAVLQALGWRVIRIRHT